MDMIAKTDMFFAGKTEAWTVFESLLQRIVDIYPQTQLRVMKTCIAFDDPKPFLYVSFPPKKSLQGLWLSVSLREMMTHPRIAMLVPVSKSRCTAHIHLADAQGIDDELLALIALSHR